MGYHANYEIELLLPRDSELMQHPERFAAKVDLDVLVEDGFDGNHAKLLGDLLGIDDYQEAALPNGDKAVRLAYRGAVTGWEETHLSDVAAAGATGHVLAQGEDGTRWRKVLVDGRYVEQRRRSFYPRDPRPDVPVAAVTRAELPVLIAALKASDDPAALPLLARFENA